MATRFAQGEYDFPGFVEGATWKGVPRLVVRAKDGDPPFANLTDVLCYFRKRPDDTGTPLAILSVQLGSIVINDAAAGDITIPEQVLGLKAGTYFHDLKFTYADGTIRKPIAGKIEGGKSPTAGS